MAATTGILWGSDASCTGPAAGLFNAFTVTITQGTTQAAGFGDAWIRTRGTIGSISGSMSGFVKSGSGNSPATIIGSIGASNRTGSTATFTFQTSGDSISFTGIMSGLGYDVQYLGNQTLSVGVTGDGDPTVSWSV